MKNHDRYLIWLLVMLAGGSEACLPAHDARHGEHSEPAASESDHHAPSRALDADVVAAARRIRVLPHHLDCPSEVVGFVDVHERVASVEAALDVLRVEAAELGAEAVTGVEFEHGDGKEVTHLSGLAVRCRDLVKGRAYDVIAEIDLPGTMGDEEEAFRLLKERGRALRADLLVKVRFEHGEPGRGPTRIRATAVRFRDRANAAAQTL